MYEGFQRGSCKKGGKDSERVKTGEGFRWSWKPSEWRRRRRRRRVGGERDSERLYLGGNHFGVAA